MENGATHCEPAVMLVADIHSLEDHKYIKSGVIRKMLTNETAGGANPASIYLHELFAIQTKTRGECKIIQEIESVSSSMKISSVEAT